MNICGVLDDDKVYAKALMEFMMERSDIPFQVKVFTGIETVREVCENITMLVVGINCMSEELESLGIGHIVILEEEKYSEYNGEYKMLYKYQDCDKIINELISYYTEKCMVGFTNCLCKTRIIGVYSPIKRCGKTSIALALSNILGETSGTLFLCMDIFEGFHELIGASSDSTMDDLLYRYMTKQEDELVNVSDIVVSLSNMQYIPPVTCFNNIKEIKVETWRELVLNIAANGRYNNIVIDIGTSLTDAIEMLSICEVTYMPVLSDEISKRRLEIFQRYLTVDNKNEGLRIISVTVPVWEGSSEQGYAEGILWGEVSSFARNLIGELENGQNSN